MIFVPLKSLVPHSEKRRRILAVLVQLAVFPPGRSDLIFPSTFAIQSLILLLSSRLGRQTRIPALNLSIKDSETSTQKTVATQKTAALGMVIV